ncbi:macrolide family glycosyltransferase [Amycolatopsis australiensis]|uniref:macrolide family glycosyltransferase n=1 Tax=Amycolatopsis australiensis TaxID=546364 RepID=UPI0015A549D4|nr:macrolide family glycosyltransferase [Amycolatopsis australiensis]
MTEHVVVCTLPGHGHVTPVLDILGELVRRGHRVTVATGGGFADRIAATGATPVAYAEPAGADPGAHRLAAALTGAGSCLAPLAPLRKLLADDPPGVLAFDSTMWIAGRVLAHDVACPTVQLSACFASNEHYSLPAHVARFPSAEVDDVDSVAGDHDFAADLTALLAAEAPGRTAEQFLDDGRDHKLVLIPRGFQYAGETFDARHTFTGPCFGPQRPLTGWEPPANGDPVLLVSLGTSAFNDQPGFFRQCARAFADLPWTVVMTLGGGTDPASLGPLPPNVEARPWVPHPAVLRHASAFVTSAGMGSVMEALYCGTPLVLVPMHGEQEVNTERVVQLGLGHRLPRAEVTPERIRDAVLAVAADEGIGARMRAMRDHTRESGGAVTAADRILGHARS